MYMEERECIRIPKTVLIMYSEHGILSYYLLKLTLMLYYLKPCGLRKGKNRSIR